MIGTVSIRDELANQVGDLRIGTAGHQRIGQIETCGNRLSTHGLAGSRLTSKQEVSHRLLRCCRQLRMLANTYHFMWDDVPVRELGDHRPFAVSQNALCHLIMIHEIVMADQLGHRRAATSDLQDGEVTIHRTGRRVAAVIDCQLRQVADVSGRRDRKLNARLPRSLGILNATIHVVTELKRCLECRIHIRPAGCHSFFEVRHAIVEFRVFVKYRHQAKQKRGAGAITSSHGIRHCVIRAFDEASGNELTGGGIEHNTIGLIGRDILCNPIGCILMTNRTKVIGRTPLLRCIDQLRKRK